MSVYTSELVNKKTGTKSWDDGANYSAITPDLAQNILSTKLWDRQRPVRQYVVDRYSKLMEEMAWQPGSPLRFVVFGNKTYLMDGQHRLSAIVKSGKAQVFSIITQAAHSESEIGLIYSSIDRGLSRTPFDQIHAVRADDMFGWNVTQTNVVMSAIAFIEMRFNSKGRSAQTYSGNDYIELVNIYGGAADKYLSTLGLDASPITKAMRRRAVASVGIITFQESEKKYGNMVYDFWRGVSADDGLRNTDSRKYVVNHLLTTHMTGGNSRAGGNGVSAIYSSRYVANCFNAFLENRQIKSFLRVNESTPIKILGSKFKG